MRELATPGLETVTDTNAEAQISYVLMKSADYKLTEKQEREVSNTLAWGSEKEREGRGGKRKESDESDNEPGEDKRID